MAEAKVADEKATQVADEKADDGPIDTGVAEAAKKSGKQESDSVDHGVGLLYR
jgi:hypothetical protein